MKKTKFAALALSGVLALSAFSACGGGGNKNSSTENPNEWNSLDSGETIQLVFAGRDVATEKANYQAFVDEFNNTHDNIVVELRWWDSGSAYNIALDGMGENLPDVFMLNDMMFSSYAVTGKLANVRGHLDESVMSDMYESACNEYYYDHATKKIGKTENAALYGLPKDNGPYALAINEAKLKERVNEYNNKAAEADKIDLNKVLSTTEPMKFSYFLELGNKLKTVIRSNEYVLSGYDIESTVYSNNANYFTDDTAVTAAIDSDNFVGAIQFIQNLYKDGILPPAGSISSAETQFTSGNALFYYGAVGPWKTKDYWKTCSFDWNILPMLCGDAEGSVSTACVGSMVYAISNKCKYKDAALEVVKYFSTDVSAQRTQYARGQCIPNLLSLANEYITDSQGFIAKQAKDQGASQAYPSNRSVWVDTVDGAGATKKDASGNDYTDKITGKYRAASYTFDSLWQTELNQFMSGQIGSFGSFWQANNGKWVDVKAALTSYKSTMQKALDDSREILDFIK